MGRQPWSKYVGDISQLITDTHWASFLSSGPTFDSIAQQHRLSVAKFVTGKISSTPKVQSGLMRQPVINISQMTGWNETLARNFSVF